MDWIIRCQFVWIGRTDFLELCIFKLLNAQFLSYLIIDGEKTQQALIIAFNCCLLWSESYFYLNGVSPPNLIIAVWISTELASKDHNVLCNQTVSQHSWKVGKPVLVFSCKIHRRLLPPPTPSCSTVPTPVILNWNDEKKF